MRAGVCYRLEIAAHLNCARASGYAQNVHSTPAAIARQGRRQRQIASDAYNFDLFSDDHRNGCPPVALFPSPNAADYRGAPTLAHCKGRAAKSSRGVRLAEHISIQDDIEVRGLLNPEFVEWLMGWPRGWTSLEPLTGTDYADHWRQGEWQGVPRVALKVARRADRIRALGNGQVPQCFATAWHLLADD